MKENYSFRNTTNDRLLELDVYLPDERLAFEYQGEQHYLDIYALGNHWRQLQRDQEKRVACAEQGITLVEIPYWWEFEKPSLMATIHQKMDRLFRGVQVGSPIPERPPGGIAQGAAALMQGEDWDGKQDLSGW